VNHSAGGNCLPRPTRYWQRFAATRPQNASGVRGAPLCGPFPAAGKEIVAIAMAEYWGWILRARISMSSSLSRLAMSDMSGSEQLPVLSTPSRCYGYLLLI